MKRKKDKHSPLFWSSLVFTTNMIHAFLAGFPLYSLLFASLTITSLIHHATYTVYSNILDKLAILSIVMYGGYLMWNKRDQSRFLLSICVITFLLCILFYIYGYMTRSYCFAKKNCDDWHMLLHIVGSFGHHMILLL
jgi:hypothetical protein